MHYLTHSSSPLWKICCLLVFMLSAWACTVSLEFDVEGCPSIKRVNAVGIEQIFFSPFSNQQPANSDDTVAIHEFRLNFELTFESFQQAQLTPWLPGIAFAIEDCEPRYSIQNISNIMIILNEPFHGLSIGTDVAFLLSTNEDVQLNRLRDFSNSRQFFTFRLNQSIQGPQQLNANLIVSLRNGSTLNSSFISPMIKN
ncbi:hypothetical protein [Mongoliitalea daihaiensis]|uniref:hypothetical protein n=1 Tax=Mongoliitalea daihaiensis TaxID=2782006 RepID=UPI001F26FA48|nr:hypothetical protein [Mongoliitalea daihaiensis]UJP63559.1 hypothetical protein IPZ59_11985 [Mongoliitalea daihaiensis]